MFLGSLRFTRRADNRTSSHLQQRAAGRSQRVASWPVGQQDRLPVRTETKGPAAPSAVKLRCYFLVIRTVDLFTLHIFN